MCVSVVDGKCLMSGLHGIGKCMTPKSWVMTFYIPCLTHMLLALMDIFQSLEKHKLMYSIVYICRHIGMGKLSLFIKFSHMKNEYPEKGS